MCVYHALCCTLILSCCTLCLAYIREGTSWPTCIRRSDVPVSVESGRYKYKRTTSIRCFSSHFSNILNETKRNNYEIELQMKKFRLLPLIEIVRRVSNWSLHQKIEDEIQYCKNLIFISPKSQIYKIQVSNQDPLNQTKLKHCLEL